MPDLEAEEVGEDALLGGRVRLLQPRGGHRAGTDAVLLAALAKPRPGGTTVDLGAGTGAVGLMIAVRSVAGEIVLVERDPRLARLCGENIGLNGLGGRARAIEADILASAAERRRLGLLPASADLVVTNPPYLEPGHSRRSPDPRRAGAHELAAGDLERWIANAADLLKPKGRLALIHRADSLGRCLRGLESRFGEIQIRGVHPRQGQPAIRILVSALKGSGAALRLLSPLVLHDADGGFTPEAAALHAGEAVFGSA